MELDFGGAYLAVGVLLVFVIVGGPLLIHYSSRKTTQRAPSRKTTQHAPHTPLWRRVLSLPTTRLGWWAIGLAAPALAFIVLNVLDLQLLPDGDLVLIALTLAALAGGLVGLIALARDQSLLVWVAQVPALIIFSFLFGFGYEGGALVPVTTVTVLWAFIAFGVVWSFKDLPERRSP